MIVIEETRIVYKAPSAGRAYLTRRAAVRAEAVAIIKKKYPTEKPEYDTGYPGWHWESLERSVVLLRRMMRLVDKSSRKRVTP